MTYRFAKADDCALLAGMNQQLIQDERHRNRMTLPELEERMRKWLSAEYHAVIFEHDEQVLAYALYREQPDEIYLRHLFVLRDRRRQGIGRNAMNILFTKVWPKNKRLTVDVLIGNADALAFWRAVGYADYCLTLEILPNGGR